MMTVQEILEQAVALPVDERKQLVKALENTLIKAEATPTKKRNILEFAGIAKHLANDEDPQDYINRIRDEWDQP